MSNGQQSNVSTSAEKEAVAEVETPASNTEPGVEAGQKGVLQPLASPTVSLGMAVIISVFVSAITVGGGLVAYDHFRAPKIVAVDIKGYIEKLRDLYLAGKINQQQLTQGFDNMEKVVNRLPSNNVVVMGDAIIKGVKKVDLDVPAYQEDAPEKN